MVNYAGTCFWRLVATGAPCCFTRCNLSVESLWCDVHTQLFSLKIAGVEHILSMQQPLTVWAVSGADAKRLREERLARAGAAQAKALAIGLQGAGRPSARKHWHDVQNASIIAGDEVPAWRFQRGGSAGMACRLLRHRQQRQVKHVDADPEPGHVEVSPKKKRKKGILGTCRGRLRRRRGSARASRRSTRTHRGAGRNYHRCPVFTAQVGQPSCQRHRSHC